MLKPKSSLNFLSQCICLMKQCLSGWQIRIKKLIVKTSHNLVHIIKDSGVLKETFILKQT